MNFFRKNSGGWNRSINEERKRKQERKREKGERERESKGRGKEGGGEKIFFFSSAPLRL